MPTKQTITCPACEGSGMVLHLDDTRRCCEDCYGEGVVELPQVTGANDPGTSRQAEANLNIRRRETHAARMLTRLKQGPVTNRELAAISLKYTGRISDLRALGHNIECVEQKPDGTSIYELRDSKPEPAPVTAPAPQPKVENCTTCARPVKGGVRLQNGEGPFHVDCLRRRYDEIEKAGTGEEDRPQQKGESCGE